MSVSNTPRRGGATPSRKTLCHKHSRRRVAALRAVIAARRARLATLSARLQRVKPLIAAES
jgi:hypothetical protein